MNTLKLTKIATATMALCFATSAMALPSGGLFTASGGDNLKIKGNLKKTNSCDVSINKNGLFDVGTIEIKNKLDPSGGTFAQKNFKATIKCDYPSAVITKLSSSRTVLPTNPKNFSKTYTVGGNVAYRTRVKLDGGISVTSLSGLSTSGVKLANKKSNTGVLSLATVPSFAGIFNTVNSGGAKYMSSNPIHRNAFTFAQNGGFAMHKKYQVPFTVELVSAPLFKWINDIPSGKLKLNETITFKSYII